MLDINDLKKSDFYYDLPQELIAQTPIEPRNHSRLMVIDRKTGAISHDRFYNLCNYLKKGDTLIVNDSRVLPARIYGEKEANGTFIEFLLLEQRANMVWEILCRPGKKAKVGTVFNFGGGKLKAEIIEVLEDGNRIAKFSCEGSFYAVLDEIGGFELLCPDFYEALTRFFFSGTPCVGVLKALPSAEELTRRVDLPPEYLEAAYELHGLLASDPDTLILETTGRYDFNAEGALRHWTEEYAM